MGQVHNARMGYVGDRATYLKALFNDETGQTSMNADVQAAAERLRGILDDDDARHSRKRSPR